MENSNQYASDKVGKQIEPVPSKEDSYLRTDVDSYVKFVETGREYGVTLTEVYQTPEGDERKNVVLEESCTVNSGLLGDEAQYYHWKPEFTTSRGESTTTRGKEETQKHFLVTPVTTVTAWPAVNADGERFVHETYMTVPDVTFVWFCEKENKDIVVEFGTSTFELSEKTTHSNVSGVVYEGKTWDAVKYACNVTSKETLPAKYRKGDASKTYTVENQTFLLKHEINTDLDKSKTNYIVNINSGERTLYQDPQTVHFELVTTDNGVEVDRKAYDFEEVFNIVARGGENKTLASEEALKAVKISSFNKGEIKSTNSTKDICSLKTFNFGDVITISDGNVINVEGIFEALGWNGNEFPYASTTSARTAVLSSVKNTALSTVSHAVYDVTLILTYPIVYNNSNKVGESKTIVIKWQDDAVIPDDIVTKDENMQYVIVTKVSDSKDELIATEQFNSWNTNTYNRGVLQSSEAHKIDLPLSVKTTNGSSVSIKKEQRGQKVSVRAIDEGTASTTDSKVEGEDYIVRTTTRTATYTMSDGGKLPVTLVHGESRKDGKNVLAHTEVKNLRVVSVETPVKNEDLSSGENEVYDVKVNFAVDLEEKGSVQTRASGDVRTEYLVANYQQTIGDELVPGSEEFILTGTKNGQSIDWKAEGYETWTLRGRIKVDEKSGKITPSMTGKDYDPMVVSNTDVRTSGNGHNGTGNGTYSNNASNGVESFVNEFGYNAPASFDVTLNFTSGAQTKQVATSFVIREGNAVVGAKSGEVNGYDVYPYASTVNGTFSALNQTVELTATDNRQLRVKKATDDVIRHWGEGTSTPNGDGFDLTARFYEERKLSGVQLLKTMTGRMEGSFKARSASDVYADNANFQTTSNGKSGSTSGTYSSTASNGAKSQNNIYDFSYDDVKVLSYNGDEVRFSGSASFAEVSSTIGNGSVNGNYTVYPYTNKAQMVYTVDGKSVTLTDQVKWNILVARPIDVPDLVPGKIKSAAITCVPANGDNASNYADGSNKRNAIKTLCIVTDEGAEAVAFAAWNNENVVVPTNNEIKSGNFVSGNYSTAYNSGYYQSGKWVPAIAKDNSWGISYSIPTQENIRSIRNETLKQWNWRNGNYSVFVDGYTFDVDANGVLTVRYKGEVVLQCK